MSLPGYKKPEDDYLPNPRSYNKKEQSSMEKKKKKEEEKVIKKEIYPTGATRSILNARYDLIPPIAARLLAERMALGARIHGDDNYKKGIPIHVIINHIKSHLNDFEEGIFEGSGGCFNHVAAILANAAILAFELDQDSLAYKKFVNKQTKRPK